MQHETALGAKLAAKGFMSRIVRLDMALAEFRNNGGTYAELLERAEAAFADAAGSRLKHAARTIAERGVQLRNGGEEGRSAYADRANGGLPSSPSPERSAGRATISDKVMPVVPVAALPRDRAGPLIAAEKATLTVPRPVSPAYITAAKEGAKVLAITVLDSFKVRDGRPIGDVPWSSLDHLISAGGREVAVLKLVRNRGVPTDRNMPIRLLVGVQEMERIVQKAAEMVDAA